MSCAGFNRRAGCRRRGRISIFAVAALLIATVSSARAETPLSDRPALRRPIGLVHAGPYLLVANSRSGTLSVLQRQDHKLLAEYPLGPQLADLVAHPGEAWDALAIEQQTHRLLAVSVRKSSDPVPQFRSRELARLAPYPQRLLVAKGTHRVLVSSLWSRKLTILDFDPQFARLTRQREVELSFPARELALVDGERRVLVADAFGGRLAIVNVDSGTLEMTRKLSAHNIRGLLPAADGKTVYLSHQTLDSASWTDRDDVHWGVLLANSLHGLRTESLLDAAHEPMQSSWLEPMGLVGRAAGDPGPVLVDPKGRLMVALAGVGEVSITAPSYAQTVPVGRRPSALASIDDTLYVANQFDDSITVIDLLRGTVTATVSLGPAARLTPVDRGERLFFDARLSHDRWMSCHSCHSEGHTIGQRADTMGDGGYGAPKRIPSLLGTRSTAPWAWNGSARSLPEQVRKSIRTTMHGRPLENAQVEDLVAYLEQLPSPPSHRKTRPRLVAKGRLVFKQAGCIQCHAPPTYTSPQTVDVGLEDELGAQSFNPPSLLGLGQRDAFFHDSRTTRIEDVILDIRHQLPKPLTQQDAEALIEFLKSL